LSALFAAPCLLQLHITTMDTKNTKERIYKKPNEAAHAVIGCALRVHSALGAGVLESTVSAWLLYELQSAGLHVEHQVHLPLVYQGMQLSAAYRVDFIVGKCLIIEIKCVEKLLPVHTAQLLSYLKLTELKPGLLINFNVPHLRQGIHRVINSQQSEL
jgi:GxxExxY protein